MISRFCLAAALVCGAGAAGAQTAQPDAPQPPSATPTPAPAPPSPPPSPAQAAIAQTATAFGQCVSTGVQGLAATVTPQAGATAVLGGCASQRQQLEQAVEAFIATMPEEQKAGAREQFSSQMAGVEAQIAAGIAQQRAAAAPTPAPAPAPAPAPTPTPQ